MHYFLRKPWLTAVLIPGLLLLLFNLAATPLLNSGDDAFMLYTIAGGYGDAPTNLLHYNHILHPFIGYVLKSLFQSAPGLNWYSVLLVSSHWVANSIILYVLIRRLPIGLALLLYFIFFLFLESRQLMSLNITGTAMIIGSSALALLLHQMERSGIKHGNTLLAIIAFLLAGLLRMHVAWLLMLLFLPFVAGFLPRRRLMAWIIFSFVFFSGLFILNKIHERYYKKSIPGWENQEGFRQALFYSYNRPLKQKELINAFEDSSEYQLFFAGFLYDSLKFPTERVKMISHNITRKRWLNEKEDSRGLYWFFMELRIYILLFGLILGGLLLEKSQRVFRKWIWSLIAVGGVYAFLFVFLKITPPLHLGLLSLLFLQLAMSFTAKDNFIPARKTYRIAVGGILILLFAWMGNRIMNENRLNKHRAQQFRCAVNELNQHPQKLFVATADIFPMGFFSIWDVPADYHVHNLIYKDRLLTGTYRYTLQRFGIKDLQSALFDDENVYLLGPVLPALEKTRPSGITSGKFPGYRCLEVRKLIE